MIILALLSLIAHLTLGSKEPITAAAFLYYIFYPIIYHSRNKRTYLKYVLETTLTTLILVEAGSLFYYLGIAAKLDLPLVWRTASWDLAIFYWLHPIIPLLVLAFLFSPLLKPGIKSLKLLAGKEKKQKKPRKTKIKLPSWKTILLISLSIAAFTATTLYLPTLNPTGEFKGVDPNTRYYPHLKQIYESPDRIKAAIKIGYDRPLSYIIMFLLSKLAGIELTVKLMPLICSLLYVIAVYYFSKTLLDATSAKIATLFSAISYTTTAGLFGGLYSNWTAISLSLLAIAFLYKKGKINTLIFSLLYFATLATHIYYGAVYAAILTITLLIAPAQKDKRTLKKAPIIILVSVIALAIAFTIFKTPVTRMYNAWLRIITKTINNPTYIFGREWWNTYLFNLYNYAAGAALDIIAWTLALTGMLLYDKKPVNNLLTAWLVVATPLLLLAPFNLQWRVLYDIPYPIYQAPGTTIILSKISGKNRKHLLILILLIETCHTIRFTQGITFVKWT